MSNTSNASKNVRRFLLLFALGVAYGFMYVMPYMKSSFYDQMIAAMGCTNAQLGSLMTYYTVSYTHLDVYKRQPASIAMHLL